MMLEDLLQGSETLAFIVNRPVNLDAQTEILALRSSNERLQKQLESAAQRDPERYAPIIRRYQAEIGNNLNKIIELESGAGGGGRPPRGGSGIPARDEYQKEKTDLVRYFSKDAVSTVLKTDQDMTYAAMGLRLLNSMGKRLDNYEIGLPADYRLEILKRVGRQVKIFEGRDIAWYQPPETMEGCFVFRTDFIEDPSRPVPNRKGLSSYQEPFESGFARESGNYAPLWRFVFLRGEAKYPYIGTSKNKLPSVEEFTWKTRECYSYVINPRAFNTIDTENSYEAQYERFKEARAKDEIPRDKQTNINDPENALKRQKEITFIDEIDPRDIKGCFKVEWKQVGGKLVPKPVGKFIPNPNYLPSHWELPRPYIL